MKTSGKEECRDKKRKEKHAIREGRKKENGNVNKNTQTVGRITRSKKRIKQGEARRLINKNKVNGNK